VRAVGDGDVAYYAPNPEYDGYDPSDLEDAKNFRLRLLEEGNYSVKDVWIVKLTEEVVSLD
jgi:hypothetical protein